MLASRGLILSRAVSKIAQHGSLVGTAIKNRNQLQLIRHSGDWTYRTAAESQPLGKRIWVQACGGCKFHQININSNENKRTIFILMNDFFPVMWWWILWHLYWDWGHIVGEFEYPDVSAWTDEELGIPPDDNE